jgi:hypothetical protein
MKKTKHHCRFKTHDGESEIVAVKKRIAEKKEKALEKSPPIPVQPVSTRNAFMPMNTVHLEDSERLKHKEGDSTATAGLTASEHINPSLGKGSLLKRPNISCKFTPSSRSPEGVKTEKPFFRNTGIGTRIRNKTMTDSKAISKFLSTETYT